MAFVDHISRSMSHKVDCVTFVSNKTL
jgi:hypothetical protein